MQLWLELIPLVLGSALVPTQVIIVILLLRSPGGALAGLAFVGGMTLVRVAQGLLFGVLYVTPAGSDAVEDSDVVVATVMLVISALLFATAARTLAKRPDPDDPPPRWLRVLDKATPWRAFLLGAGIIALSPKFWIFTLGAITAIAHAKPGVGVGFAIFLLFVALAQSIVLVIVLLGLLAPKRSARVLERIDAWLTRRNRPIIIVVSLVFGVWFLVQALVEYGVLRW